MVKSISVNLSRQIVVATDGDRQVYKFDCAAGDKEHRTPIGRYSVYKKDLRHFSSKYKAQMDYALFFHGGYAIHMSHIVGLTSYLKVAGVNSLGSHGCVRLSEADAKSLFNWAPIGTTIVISQA